MATPEQAHNTDITCAETNQPTTTQQQEEAANNTTTTTPPPPYLCAGTNQPHHSQPTTGGTSRQPQCNHTAPPTTAHAQFFPEICRIGVRVPPLSKPASLSPPHVPYLAKFWGTHTFLHMHRPPYRQAIHTSDPSACSSHAGLLKSPIGGPLTPLRME